MGQNTSTAVMQRRVESRDSLDDFPTPPWATRALCEHVLPFTKSEIRKQSVWEPACNRGFMAKPLGEYFRETFATDIHDYGWEGQLKVWDFLLPRMPNEINTYEVDWIITNPPFRLAEQFIHRAFEIANEGVAVIVRSAFLEGKGRYQNLFAKNPPSIVAQFVERVAMVKGRYDPKISSATSYSWLVWMQGEEPTKLIWIPPAKADLFHQDDPVQEAMEL